jgi:hypothetical protein
MLWFILRLMPVVISMGIGCPGQRFFADYVPWLSGACHMGLTVVYEIIRDLIDWFHNPVFYEYKILSSSNRTCYTIME